MNGIAFIKSKQRNWAKRNGIALTSEFAGNEYETDYLAESNLNLFEPLSEKNAKLFGKIDKKEMKQLCSTSAACLNLFQYWQGKDVHPLLNALRLPSRNNSAKQIKNLGSKLPEAISVDTPLLYPVKLKQKFEFDAHKAIFPHPVTIDVLINAEFDFAIETQFTDPYRDIYKGLESKYIEHESFWKKLPNLHELAKEISPHNYWFRHLDVARLIKDIIVLRKAYEEPIRVVTPTMKYTVQRRFFLVYLWYDTLGRDGAAHRNEIEEFAKIAEKDFIDFRHITYQEVIAKLANDFYEGNEKYCDYMTGRYL